MAPVTITLRPSMAVVGLDLSTKTGVVVLGPAEEDVMCNEITAKRTARLSGLDRAEWLTTEVCGVLTEVCRGHDKVGVLIEDYGYSNAHTLALLVELSTAIRLSVRVTLKNYTQPAALLVSPTGLKKFVAGKGTAKKDTMRLEAYKRWGFEHASDNVVDAYCLARMARVYYGVEPPAAQYQKEATEKIRQLV